MKPFKKSFTDYKEAAEVSGVQITPEILAKINTYALTTLTEAAVYVRKYLIAHNAVDRDNERFSEAILDDFAATMPGKNYLFAHDKHTYLPIGLFFDASTEVITPARFKEMTGETPRLPDGTSSVKILWAHFYILRNAGNDDIIKSIEGGVLRHGSIGFAASDLVPVKGQFGQTLYYEYVSPGEATEGSLVWLGAQNGATTQKTLHMEGEKKMSILKNKIAELSGKSLPADATEDVITQTLVVMVGEKNATISSLEKIIAESKQLVEDGKAWRSELVADYVKAKALLGECESTPEASSKIKEFAASMPIDFLKTEVKSLNARVLEKFPDQGQLNGDMRRDKTTDGKTDNPLIPSDK